MTRKDFISSSALSAAGISLGLNALGSEGVNKNEISAKGSFRSIQDGTKMKVCVFSKQLQFLNYQDMASHVAEMGFDGIDLTVRKDGHVLPERVAEDLPKAVEAAKKAGIEISMISTDIRDVNETYTEKILATAASLGISRYRVSGLSYQKNLEIIDNLELIKAKFTRLAEMNKKLGLYCDYLNHSGEGFGSSIWDLWLTLKDLDPKYIGSQFDINHSTIAGAFSWPVDLQLIHKFVHTTVIRDFKWEKNKNVWEATQVPLGEGMVNFKKYFSLVKKYEITGPICLMCDYDIAGAEHGSTKLTGSPEIVFNAMKKDLGYIKQLLKETGN